MAREAAPAPVRRLTGTARALVVATTVGVLLAAGVGTAVAQGGVQTEMRQDQHEREVDRGVSGGGSVGVNEDQMWVWWVILGGGALGYLWRSDRANRDAGKDG